MWPDIDALAGRKLHGPDVIEEDERPDHATTAVRQYAAHFEAAEIAGARLDELLDRT